MRKIFSDKSKIAALGLISAVTYTHVGYSLLFPAGMPRMSASAAFAHVAEKKPMTVASFRADVEQYSKNNMMVVLLRRNACDICDDVESASYGARSWLQKKTGHGFTFYALNAEQNPELAALLRQRDPQAGGRLHVFYNGEKIYESRGLTDNPQHMGEVLEMVQALADGEVSIYDKYEPANIFDTPLSSPSASSAPAP